LLEALRKLPSTHLAARITRTAAFFAALASVAGRLSHREGVAVKLDLIPFGPIICRQTSCCFRHPQYILGGWRILLALVALALVRNRREARGLARSAELTWKRNQFCRGWLITGDTGSGKTSSGINQLAHQVFQNEPTWGGLCIDEKGVYWETLAAMARHYGREHDLIHLQIRADDTDTQWTPPNRYNLTGDRSIPFTTYAKFVVDTATSLGQGGDKGFFKSQAQTHIAHALEMLFELNPPGDAAGAFELLSDRELLEEEMENLEALLETPRRAAVYAHFANRFLTQPDEQLGGVRETIATICNTSSRPKSPRCFAPAKARSISPRLTRQNHPHHHAAEVSDRAALREHVPEAALLQSRLAPLRQSQGRPRQRQFAHPVGRRSAAIHDRQRGRHERLQLRGRDPRSRRNRCRRRTKHDFTRATAWVTTRPRC
jgi:hypothetical protein